jgi:hypothetical protein
MNNMATDNFELENETLEELTDEQQKEFTNGKGDEE